MTAPAVRTLRIIYYPGTGKLLRSFVVLEAEELMAYGYTGPGGVYLALKEQASLWYHKPNNDVPSAVRAVLRIEHCEIIVEAESSPEPEPEEARVPEAQKGGLA
jgi:hypothetical protein